VLVRKADNFWLVETDEGLRLRGTATTEENTNWQIGRRVTLCFKPEEALADPLPSSNHVRGKVQLVE
jgi:hypothetical protein